MSLTPAEVHAVRFRTALRGYSTAEVDAFLDRVASALSRLQEEVAALRALTPGERGGTTPPRPLPGETGEEAALRTLLLAQRTADQVVADACDEADRELAAARAEAERLLAEAESRAEDVRRRAEAERAELDRELARHREEALADVEADRRALEDEVAQLADFEREYRSRLTAHLESQLQEIQGATRGSGD